MNQPPNPPPKASALRVQRLQVAHNLRLIANLQARIQELEKEHAQLEAIIAAQACEISALRQAARAPAPTITNPSSFSR